METEQPTSREIVPNPHRPSIFQNKILLGIVICILLFAMATVFQLGFQKSTTQVAKPTSVSVTTVPRPTYNEEKYASMDAEFKRKSKAKLLASGLHFYTVKKPIGRFMYQKYEYNYYSDPAYVTLVFSNNLRAQFFTIPPYFNPPDKCSQTTPQKFNGPISTFYFPCTPVGKTTRGYDLYEYRQTNSDFIEHYYAKTADSIITLSYFPNYITRQEAIDIFDSLESVSPEEFIAAGNQASEQTDRLAKNASAYVNFDVYVPQVLPGTLSIQSYLLGNVKNPKHPDLAIVLTDKNNTDKNKDESLLTITEFKSTLPFNPPNNCGYASAESEDTYASDSKECELLTTTPKGIKIYTDRVDAFFFIGETKIGLYTYATPFQDTDALVKTVDSMVKTPLTDISYETL